MNRRDEILVLAGDLIQEHGYKGFSYADLSKALGITKASIHHHFPSKEQLGIAYCDQKIARLRKFREELSSIESADAKLESYFGLIRGCGNKKLCGINAMQSDSSGMSEELVAKIRNVTDVELELLTEVLTYGLAKEEFKFDIPPYDMALLIVASLKGVLMLARIKKDDSLERVCNAIRKRIEYS